MKDVFDYLEEEDLLRNLPEALPQMEDETAAKRIENVLFVRVRQAWLRVFFTLYSMKVERYSTLSVT